MAGHAEGKVGFHASTPARWASNAPVPISVAKLPLGGMPV